MWNICKYPIVEEQHKGTQSSNNVPWAQVLASYTQADAKGVVLGAIAFFFFFWFPSLLKWVWPVLAYGAMRCHVI